MDRTERLSDGAVSVSKKILALGVAGTGGLKGAVPLAEEYLRQHEDPEKAIDRLIASQVGMTAATGFATNIGGLMTLPVAIPADMGSLWLLQGRLAGAVAHLRGYDVESEEVRTAILISLLGSAGAELLKEVGVKVGNKGAAALLSRLPAKVLIEINKKVGFRLLTKAGTTGAINFTKFVPLAGGVVGGTINGVSTKAVGTWAKKNFPAVQVDDVTGRPTTSA